VIRLFNFISKLICTSLYIVLDEWLEIAAIEDLFLKTPVMETVQGQIPARTWSFEVLKDV